jgi:hypothetical protein
MRREFIAGLGGAVVWPLVARAQQAGRVRLVGIAAPLLASDVEAQRRVRAFREELTSGIAEKGQYWPLLDHLVGAGKQ